MTGTDGGSSCGSPAGHALFASHSNSNWARISYWGSGVNRAASMHMSWRARFVCLVPDYPGFGEYKYDFAVQASKALRRGTMKAI